MKEIFLKTVNTILEHNGACDKVLCKECPFSGDYDPDALPCDAVGYCTPGSYAQDRDPVLVESCKKWKKENEHG